MVATLDGEPGGEHHSLSGPHRLFDSPVHRSADTATQEGQRKLYLPPGNNALADGLSKLVGCIL